MVGNLVPRDVMALVEAFTAGRTERAASGTHVCFPSAAICWDWPPIPFR